MIERAQFMKNKKFIAHVEFDSLVIYVSAKNMAEAKKKIIGKVSKRSIKKLIDKHNFFIDECSF